MDRIRQLLREPLVHFIAAGSVLFAAYVLVRGPAALPPDATTIVVDRRALLAFMQYRANAFEPETFEAAFEAMSADEVQRLVDAYITEEILYREARALGLDESDYIIRQRMIQKLDFLLGNAIDATTEIDAAELEKYLAVHRDDYVIEPAVTFTHVFYDSARRGAAAAQTAAESARNELTRVRAAFNDAIGQGDRFPFLKNYVERTLGHVASHFGAEFAAELAELTPSVEHWQGPIRSAYGEHVVLLTERTERRDPELAEIRAEVERDYLTERATTERATLLARHRERYRVEVLDLGAGESE